VRDPSGLEVRQDEVKTVRRNDVTAEEGMLPQLHTPSTLHVTF